MSSEDATCLRCGMKGLVWAQSVKGKWYLGIPMQHTFEDGNTVTTHIAGHNCVPTEEGLALVEARRVEREREQAEKQAKIDAFYAERAKLHHFECQVGEVIEFSGVIETAITIDGYYGSQRLLTIKTPNYEVAKIISTAQWTWEVVEGDSVTVKGIVSAFEEYQGVPQTLIKKPKLVSKNEEVGV